jgi:hypothetical protein
MLNDVGDLITELLVRNNRTTTDSFVTDAMLQGWTRMSHTWAAAYHKWPFTEGRLATTYATGSGPGSDEWYFEGYKSDSLRMLQVGGKRLTKLNFEDYQIMREESPGADDRVFSDFGRTVFINPNADISGTLYAYLQYEPNIDPTDLAATTVFSGYDEEGNEALIEKMTAYLKRREHLAQEAELHDARAAAKLEEVWKRVQDEQYAYKTHPERGGMWERFDVLDGRPTDEFKRDQF